MSTTRKLAHNTIVQFIGKIISTSFGIVALLMMTNYLGAEQFGWYTTVISFLGFAGILIDFGMIPLTAQMLSEPKFNKKKLFNNLLTFRLVTAIIFFSFVPIIGWFFPYPQEVKIAITFTSLSFLAISLNQIFIGYYQTKLRIHIQSIAEAIGRLGLVIGVWLLITQEATFLPFMIAVTGASILYTILLWIFTAKETKIGLAYDKNIWKTIIKKMWPIALAIMFNVIYLKGDILLLAHYHSQVDVGIYGAAYRVLDILGQLAMMMIGLFMPLLAYAWSRNKKQDFALRLQQSFDTLMMFIVPAIAGLILLAPKVVKLFGNEDFLASALPLQILSIGLFGIYLGAIFGHAAVAIDKQKQTLWIYASNAVITLVGYFIFIPKYGIPGAAWMTVFSELYAGFLLFITVWYFCKCSIYFRTLFKIIFSAAVMSFGIYYLKFLPLFPQIIIGMIIYAMCLFATKAISIKTLKEILSLKKVSPESEIQPPL